MWNLPVERTTKCSGTLNKKKLPLFDKSLMTLDEFLHQTMLSFIGTRFCSIFGSNHKSVPKTDRKMTESILKN